MPFDDDTFQLVLFDPPHVVQETVSGASELILRYGAYAAANEQEEIGMGFSECWRVLAPGGTLVFKWAGSLERVERHFPCDPVVGSRAPTQGRKTGLGTRWFIFYKPLTR
jgi:SAM-dependent methyltransferase